ncbi:cupin domain-containing protein [Streptomyces sp. MP131-18]|uniref:cupin domain-containing protein n=1 Tax=Streptomyces sp. MP131-18 TaxID=1857892 RepID=UPI0009D2F3FB|nr:cupin domain-containing protein [Streptomyces sp. MP131-18]ONK16055.1 hypothetical protein STBA_69050 [Streptomyces sp. MP131-18]
MTSARDLAPRLRLTADPAGGWAGPAGGHPGYGGRPLVTAPIRWRTRMLDTAARHLGWRRCAGDLVLFRHPAAFGDGRLRVCTRTADHGQRDQVLGESPRHGEHFQLTVPAGQWHRIELAEGEGALWSEAVVPGTGTWEYAPDEEPASAGESGRRAAAPTAAAARPATPEGPELARLLELTPHVEGGYYRQLYQSAASMTTFRGPRPYANTIHYLLDARSPTGHLHLNTAHITHFLHSGGPIEYILLSPDGTLHEVVMGTDTHRGQVPVFTCPGGWWKASRLPDDVGHGLISEIVAPGFDFADQSIARPDDVAQAFPQHLERLAPVISGGPETHGTKDSS